MPHIVEVPCTMAVVEANPRPLTTTLLGVNREMKAVKKMKTYTSVISADLGHGEVKDSGFFFFIGREKER